VFIKSQDDILRGRLDASNTDPRASRPEPGRCQPERETGHAVSQTTDIGEEPGPRAVRCSLLIELQLISLTTPD
jgi:hypothetical protein